MATIDNLTLDINLNDNASAKLEKLAGALSALKDLSISGAKFNGIAKGVNNLNTAINNITDESIARLEKLANALAAIGAIDASSISKVARAVGKFSSNTANTGNAQRSAYSALKNQIVPVTVTQEPFEGKASSADDVREFYGSYREVGEEILQTKEKLKQGFGETESEFKARVDSIAQSMRNLAGTPFRVLGKAFVGLGSAIKKIMAPLNGFIRSLGRIALYRALRGIIKAISSGIKEGVQNLAHFSKLMNEMDTHKANRVMSLYASNFLYLKNTIATAVIPILKTLEPIVSSIINKVIDLTNVIAQLFSAISGSATYTKAKYYYVDYAESLDKASGSASKLNKQLAKFDELNNLTTSSGSGKDNALDYLEMFEDPVPIADWIQKLKDNIQSGNWEAIGQAIADKVKYGLGSINWTSEFEKSFNAGRGFASFLNGLVDPGAFHEVGKTIAGAIMMGINFALGFAEEFKFDELGLSIAEGINGFFENFDGAKTADAITKIAHGLEEAFTTAVKKIKWKEVFKDLGTLIGKVTIDNLDLILKAVLIVSVAKFAVSFTQGALTELSRQIGAIIASKLAIKLTGLSISQIGSGVGAGLVGKIFGKAVGGVAGGTAVKGGGAVLSGSSQFASALGGSGGTATGTATTAGITSAGSAIGAGILTAIGAYMLTNGFGEAMASISPNGKFLGLSDDEWAEANPLYKIFNKEKFENVFMDFFDAIHVDDAVKNFFEPISEWFYGENGFWANIASSAKKTGDSIYGENGFWAKIKTEGEKVGKSIYGSNGFWAQIYNKSVEISSKINGESGFWRKIKVGAEEVGKSIYGEGGFWTKFVDESQKAGQSIYGSNGFWAQLKNKATEIGNNIYGSNGFWAKFAQNAKSSFDTIKNNWDNLRKNIWNDPIKAQVLITQTIQTITTGAEAGVEAVKKIVENNAKDEPTINSIPERLKLPTVPSYIPSSQAKSWLEEWKRKNPAQNYYADGGFPEKGSYFFAGESGAELVGNINGRTGVANTDQITEAMYTATYDAMSTALAENPSRFIIEGDADGMFRIMQQKANNFLTRTGRPAF